MAIFRDRAEAGQLLSEALKDLKREDQAIVLAIPGGGVVVGEVVSQKIHIPLDVIISRKIGAPHNPELAIGATTSKGGTVWDKGLLENLRVSHGFQQEEEYLQIEEAKRRERIFRGGRPSLDIIGKTVVLTDDGVATGLTMEAAIHAVENGASEIVLAIPVAPDGVVIRLKNEVSRVVVLATPETFHSVGEFYQNFEQITDIQVSEILKRTLPKA
ncbi:MAG: phosphoribosyltransferase [Patescibacteria group bacterium]|nr:phosphoribosyltransferase [Patescibacteria group bacterium]